MTPSITDVSNQFVRDAAAESPMLAVYLGLPSPGAIDDLSPAGLARRYEVESATLAAANHRAVQRVVTEGARQHTRRRSELRRREGLDGQEIPRWRRMRGTGASASATKACPVTRS